MTYTKPEINVLGDAARVIQILDKGFGSNVDPRDPTAPADFDPAYDLDE